MENKTVNKKRRKNKYAAPIGGLFILLAVIGFVTVMVQSFHVTTKIMDNSKQIERFEDIIRPVIMFDPVPFDNVEQANEIMLLQSSIWNALLKKASNEDFDYSDGIVQLTASDVDVSCAKLYGASAKLNHQTFGSYDSTYYYDTDTKTYQIPLSVQTGFYSPKIVEVTSKDDVVSLIVGYIPPENPLTAAIKDNKKETPPDKYMTYELKKVKNNYYVSAIKYPPEKYISYTGFSD